MWEYWVLVDVIVCVCCCVWIDQFLSVSFYCMISLSFLFRHNKKNIKKNATSLKAVYLLSLVTLAFAVKLTALVLTDASVVAAAAVD